ncbi:MAG: PAS domain S-box protein [Planctomycetales bacterium]|nr:PAS domain S-box protein [Planctomycetales bacterium]
MLAAIPAKSQAKMTQRFAIQQALLFALLTGVVTAIAVISVWFALNNQAQKHIDAVTEYASWNIEMLIREDLDHRLSALDRFARRWTEVGGTPRSRWEADAAAYIADIPGFQAIAWADATLHIRWIVPLAGNEAAQDMNIGVVEAAHPALDAARETGTATLTQPFDIALGGFGVTAYTPVLRGDQFDGVIVGVFRLESWLTEVFKNSPYAQHRIRILLDGDEFYTNDSAVDSTSNEWTKQSEFSVHGLAFTTVVTPTREFLSATQARWSSLLLITGVLVSGLIAAAVYLAMMARYRTGQLQETTGRLASLFQNLPGMAYRWVNEPGNPIDYVSGGCEQLSGYSRSDFEEQRVLWGPDLIHPDDRDRVGKVVQQAIDADTSFEIEYRLITRADEERWMWDRGRVVNRPGTDAVCIEGFVTDITVRKAAESKLVSAQSYAEAIVDAAIEAVITMGADDQIISFNREAQETFGYTMEEVIGRSFLMMLPEIYHREHEEYIRHFDRTNKLKYQFSRREMQLRCKDGSEFPAHVSVAEMQHQEERQFVVMISDISFEKAAEQEARLLREELAHVDRLSTLGEMASGIAHEINQPLTAISLFSQAGKRLFDAGSPEKLPAIFDKLSEHAQRAGAVIERVQSMARQNEPTKEVVGCESLLKEVAKLAESEARIRDIDVELELSNGLVPVEVDVVQIQQVVLNLLRNGMEAMRTGQSNLGNTIRLQARTRDDGDIEVAVIDRGCGVTEDAAKKLFTPFATTKESGMGMGLSISRAIIVAHGGQLEFHNNESGGATFSFTLPAAEKGDQDGY